MKTYPLTNEEGKLHAFEIENSGLGRKGLVRVVEKIPDVVLIKKPKIFSWLREEEFCCFVVESQEFSVEEPYGDNSRYLVGAVPSGWCPQLEIVEKVFSNE